MDAVVPKKEDEVVVGKEEEEEVVVPKEEEEEVVGKSTISRKCRSSSRHVLRATTGELAARHRAPSISGLLPPCTTGTRSRQPRLAPLALRLSGPSTTPNARSKPTPTHRPVLQRLLEEPQTSVAGLGTHKL